MISIIIATYNRSKSILDSLYSILNQTYQNFEIIIVDDGSTDNTEKIIETNFIDPRIRYIKLESNMGASHARNRGLEEARGDYFLVWDSDDILYPNALETVRLIFEKNPNLAVVSAPARSLLDGKEIPFKRLPEGIIPNEILQSRSLPSNHKVRIANRALCKDVRYKVKNIDFLVNVDLSEKGEWYCYPEYLADVILESDSNSLTLKRKKTDLALSKLRAPYLSEYLTKYRKVLIQNAPKRYSGFSYGASIGFFANSDYEKARYFIKEALKFDKKIKYYLLYFLILFPSGINIFKLIIKIKNYFN